MQSTQIGGGMQITDLKVICTAPDGIRLAIVKLETDSGLSGIGCATFTQFPLTVVNALENYFKPFLIGRAAESITDAWHAMYLSGYWRNGSVLNNAIAGIDQALWDIKGKALGKPVYELLGGKVRNELATYIHVNGANATEVHDKIAKLKERGFENFRVQFSIPNLASYGSGLSFHTKVGEQTRQDYRLEVNQAPWDEELYFGYTLQELRALRSLDPEIGIIHDVHERISPTRAVAFAKAVEDLGMLFLEDPVAPEHVDYLADIKASTNTPIAFGELLNTPSDFNRIISERWIAYLRCHITQIGGFTPALKLANTAASFGIKTAFHGPGDLSPVGHAAHAHLGALTTNFGIQEIYLQSEKSDSVFPGSPEIKSGKMQINNRPGFGIEIDEEAAAQFPYPEHAYNGAWPEIRSTDGSIIKP